MKKKEIKGILILLFIGLIIVALIVFIRLKGKQSEGEATADNKKEEYVQVLNDGTKLNTSKELNKDKMVDGLSFKNIQLTNKNGQTVLLADVTNTTESKTEMMLVDVVILNKGGSEIGRESGIVIPLNPGASTQFNTSTTLDYANAYDFRIEKK